MNKKFDTPTVRRVLYFVLSGLAALLGALGIGNADTIAQLTNDAMTVFDTAVPFFTALGLLLAGFKTHRGSDDDTTHLDVESARAEGVQAGKEQVREELAPIITSAPVSAPPAYEPAPYVGQHRQEEPAVDLPTYEGPTSLPTYER